MKGTPYSIRRCREDDTDAVVDLLVRIFGEGEAGSRRSREWFRWKYFENPEGHESVLAEQRDDGAVVGFYGGVPQAMRVEGENWRFGQATDTCTDPSVRRGLRNPGLFVRLAQAYLSTSAQPGRDAVGYGLPMPEAYRMGSRYLDYWMLRSQMILSCREETALPAASEPVRVEVVERFPDDVDVYFERCESAYALTATRSRAFLDWRFATHPERPYSIGVARDDDGAMRGYVVVRRALLAGREGGVIVDWMCDPDDAEGAASLCRFAAEQTVHLGVAEIMFVCPTVSVWMTRFQDWGFRVEPSPYVMVARCCDSRFQPDFVRDEWYYTLADFDLL